MRKWVFWIIVLSVSCLLPACNRATDIGQEKKNVQQAFEKYLESVNKADTELASQVWSQSPDTSAVTPLGRTKGWESIRDGLYVNVLQKGFAERSLRPDNLAITVSGSTAWVVYDWTFTAKLADGQPYSSKGWESQVFAKTDGQWRIVHLHYSAAPPPR
jgi:ketosteroid isomerase-like protein